MAHIRTPVLSFTDRRHFEADLKFFATVMVQSENCDLRLWRGEESRLARPYCNPGPGRPAFTVKNFALYILCYLSGFSAAPGWCLKDGALPLHEASGLWGGSTKTAVPKMSPGLSIRIRHGVPQQALKQNASRSQGRSHQHSSPHPRQANIKDDGLMSRGPGSVRKKR